MINNYTIMIYRFYIKDDHLKNILRQITKQINEIINGGEAII